MELALAISVLPSVATRADDLVGQVSVIDGDTIEIHGQRIRLWGITEATQWLVLGYFFKLFVANNLNEMTAYMA
ncbi:hypothetical protein [Bradyrhizobium sp. WSM1743]|uniref:hypothetical protein n=1 Tax=Bradyrhizobium sp. WSM1743 TaxID=318996 RepID=UPI0003FB1ECA|nr:hypothetical protein [Bradyrhizobium sp. WSM1743]